MYTAKRYNVLSNVFRFIRFWFKANNAHGLHSPFVYSLYTKVIKGKYNDERLKEIIRLHYQLRKSNETLNYQELYEGHVTARLMKIRKMVRHFAVNPKKARLLYRLASHFQPATILELGTSVGISSMYMAAACPKASLITMEACPESAKQAAKHHQKAGISNITIINTNFDEGFQEVLDSLKKVDMVYLDGNHHYEPTIRYFKMILPLLHKDSLVIFDDIHYSEDMMRAWKQICAERAVVASIEMFNLGIILFRDEMSKQHFFLRW